MTTGINNHVEKGKKETSCILISIRLKHCLPLGDMTMTTVITQNARNQLTAIIEDFGSFF